MSSDEVYNPPRLKLFTIWLLPFPPEVIVEKLTLRY